MEKEYKTNQRNILYDFLKSHKGKEFSIAEINRELSDKKIGESTVYRQMSKLIASGEVKRISGVNGKNVVYRFIDKDMGCDSHFHLKCEKCGTVIHLNCEKVHPLAHHIEDEHGFCVDMAKSEILGLCKNCKENA